jgi:hypothetical protein
MKNKLKNITVIIISIVVLSAMQSCFLFVKNKTEIQNPKEPVPLYIGYTKATITNYTVDGCSWMIKLEDSKMLEPVNLKDEFKKEGLKVWIQYKHYDNYSFCMAGEMVTITAIEIRELE